MELNLTNLVPDQIVKALCNTLIHSLWQGLILAVITGIAIMLTKKSTAALRYNLMIGFLLLFTAATVSTFFIELQPTANPAAVKQALTAPALQLQLVNGPVAYTRGPASAISTGISYFTSHADAIVLIWFLIICARCVQFAAGLQHIYYLRRNKTLAVGAYWERKINTLATDMGITTAVSIMQSGIAKIPMVLGHFKPVILIPIGLLTALSAEEVEAILIHELAHIRRKDFLVNLLQNLMEIIFFFNPAVLWVSALIKSERENCCDDIVVAQTSSKVSYIKALVSCEEYHSAMPAYAMGLGGKNGHFLNRVKRMLSNNNQSLNRMEKAVLTICLVSAVIVTAAFSTPEHVKSSLKVKNVQSTITKVVKKADSLSKTILASGDTTAKTALRVYKPDEVNEGTSVRVDKSVNHKRYLIYIAKKDGVLYQLNSTYDGKANTYYIDGKPVSAEELPRHQSKFDDVFNQDVPEPASPPAPRTTVQLDGEKGEIVDDSDNRATYQADRQEHPDARLDSMKRMHLHRKFYLDSAKRLHALGSLNATKSYYKQDSARGKRSYYTSYSGYSKTYKADSTTYYGQSYSAQPVPPKAPAKPAVSVPKAPRLAVGPPIPTGPAEPAAPLPNMGDEIANDLLKNDLIKDENHYSFKITNDALYIDGVKQSAETYKKIVGKYVKPGDKINFTRTSDTTKK